MTEISRSIKDLLISLKTKEEWVREGNALYNLKRHEEALATFEQAIRLDPNYSYAYYYKGNALNDLKRHEEAVQAFEQAIHLDPNYSYAHLFKGFALTELKRHEEAEQAFEKARQLGFRSR